MVGKKTRKRKIPMKDEGVAKRPKDEKNSDLKELDFVWATLPKCPVSWPAQLDSFCETGKVTVYVKSDDAYFTLKKVNVKPFPGSNLDDLNISSTDFLKKKKMTRTLQCFQDDLKWALDHYVGKRSTATGSVRGDNTPSGFLRNDNTTSGSVMDGNITSGSMMDGNTTSGSVKDGNTTSGSVMDDNTASGSMIDDNTTSGSRNDDNTTSGSVMDGNTTSGSRNDDNTTSGSVMDGNTTSGSMNDDNTTSGSVMDGNTTSGSLNDGNTTSGSMIDGNTTSGSMNDDNITSGSVMDGNTTSGSVNDHNTTSGSVMNGNTTSGSMNDDNTTSGSVMDGNTTSGSVNDDNTTSGSVMDGNTTSGSMNDDNITSGSVMDGNTTIGSVNDDNTTSGSVMDGNTTSGSMNDDNITSGSVMDGNTTIGSVNDDNTTSGSVMDGNTTSGSMNDDNITSGSVMDGNTTSGSVNDDNTTSGSVMDGNTTSGSMNDDNITSGSVMDGNTTSGSVNDDNTTSGSVMNGNITSGSMNDDNTTSGSVMDGNTTSGSVNDDNTTSGSVTDGNTTSGSVNDHNTTIGSVVDGNTTSGSVIDCITNSGSMNDDNTTSGSVMDGNTTSGSVMDGNTTSGSVNDDNTTSGSVMDGNTTSGSVMDGNTASGSMMDGNTTSGSVLIEVTSDEAIMFADLLNNLDDIYNLGHVKAADNEDINPFVEMKESIQTVGKKTVVDSGELGKDYVYESDEERISVGKKTVVDSGELGKYYVPESDEERISVGKKTVVDSGELGKYYVPESDEEITSVRKKTIPDSDKRRINCMTKSKKEFSLASEKTVPHSHSGDLSEESGDNQSEYVPDSDDEETSDDSVVYPMQGNSSRKDKGDKSKAKDGLLDEDELLSDVHSISPADSHTGMSAQNNMKSDFSSDSEEEVDENCILRDVICPDIYIKKVSKSDTTKTGKKKKYNRVFNSYQFCGICNIKVSNFAQHIDRNQDKHIVSAEIKEINEEKDQRKKADLRILLRGKFNNQNNLRVLENKRGEILLERRPTKSFDVRDFGPCPHCLLWIAKKLIFKHQKNCVAKKTELKETSSMLLTQSDIIVNRLPSEAGKSLTKEVFEVMNNDEVGKVVREDPLLIYLGNVWMQKNIDNKLKRGSYTSQILRLVGRMLLNLRKTKPLKEGSSLWHYLKPDHFDALAEATLNTAGPDTENEEVLMKPSNAIKLGYDIKRLINCKIGMAIIQNDKQSREEAENLLKTMQIFWPTKLTKLARVLLERRRYGKREELPDPQDIEKLSKSLKDCISQLDLTQADPSNFHHVAEVISSRLLMYNRRRTGELQAISLEDYHSRKRGDDKAEHLVGDCTEFEKRLLQSQELMTTGRGVPILIPSDCSPGLAFLTNMNVREEAGIKSTNTYVFANGDGVVRAYDALNKACNNASLSNPERITSTNLRKYMATITQVLDLKEHEMTWVLNHLGHTLDVHKIHYRCTSEALEKTQIAKILLLQDNDLIGKFRDKNLQEIQLSDLVPREDVARELPVLDFSQEMAEAEEEELDDDDGESEKPVKKKKRNKGGRQGWTAKEEEEIHILFKGFIEKGKRPKPNIVVKLMRVSKSNKGLIHLRKKDDLKKKVFRMVDKAKK